MPTQTPTASPTVSATPTPSTIQGPDVASYQHPATAAYPEGMPIDWQRVAADGMSFAIIKATESTSYTNPYFATDYPAALSAGLVHGAYHFARPHYPLAGTAIAQAKYFAKRIGDVNTTQTLPPVLDLEVTGGLPRADLVTWAQIFLYRLRNLTGRTPMLYTYPSFWSDVLEDPSAFGRFPLWMASYGLLEPIADLWQFTDAAAVNGIVGKVDKSRFLGASGMPWTALSDGTTTGPWPDTLPAAPHTVRAIPGPSSATVSWIPGDDGSARTTSYVVTANPGGLTAKVNGATTSATIDGLDPATAYTFTVTAVSAAGTSQPSASTAPTSPSVPTQIAPVVPASVNYGQPLRISAKLTRADTQIPSPIAGEQITVWRKNLHATSWRKFGVVTTASDGSVDLTLHPPRNVLVKLVFDGAPGYQPATSRATSVVHTVVTASLARSRIRHGSRVRLTGSVRPAIPGERVLLEQRINRKWTVGPVVPVKADGSYRFVVRGLRAKTTQRYQVLASPHHGLAEGTSPRATLTVT